MACDAREHAHGRLMVRTKSGHRHAHDLNTRIEIENKPVEPDETHLDGYKKHGESYHTVYGKRLLPIIPITSSGRAVSANYQPFTGCTNRQTKKTIVQA